MTKNIILGHHRIGLLFFFYIHGKLYRENTVKHLPDDIKNVIDNYAFQIKLKTCLIGVNIHSINEFLLEH